MPELPIPPTPEPWGTIGLLILGLALLLAGRKIFWLALGIAGFFAGWYVAQQLPQVDGDEHALLPLAIAAGFGLAGLLLAVFLQKLAIGVAGFLAGGAGALWLALALALPVGGWEWATFLVGGILGVVLARVLFEVALMILTSLLGASLLSELVVLGPKIEGILVLALTVVGCLIQSGRSGRRRRRSR